MIEGRYTISEIDAMRKAIHDVYYYRGASWQSRSGGMMGRVDDERVERELRTHMMNGTPVQELLDAAADAKSAHEAKRPTEEQDAKRRAQINAVLARGNKKNWWGLP